MKKNILFWISIFFVGFAASAQVNVTGAQGMSVTTLLEQYFSGGGVEIFNGKFNGQTTVNSNAIATFSNGATNTPNMPVAGGILMTTGAYTDAGVGSSSGIVSSSISPASDGDDVSPALRIALRSTGNTQSMNDVAVLQFEFIPSGEEISFKYSFASEEYPGFVCSSYNDVFGFFISGPYNENGELITNEGVVYNYTNIALIPGTESPVTINTVNNGTAAGSAPNCDLTNTQYFIMNGNNNCKMNGYTTELSTKSVNVVPCRIYKMELAICDVGDNAYNSAVYLAANSFRIDEYSLSKPQPRPGVENPNRFIKGCDHYDLYMYMNRPATDGEAHSLVFQGGDAVEGEDYQLTDANGNPVGTMLTFNEGDTSAMLKIQFLEDPNDNPGDITQLVIMTEEVNDCAVRDTLILELVAPTPLEHTLQRQVPEGWVEITDDIVYCGDVLPVNEELNIELQGNIGDLTYQWSYGNETTEAQNTVPVINPMTVYIEVQDGCGRVLQDSVVFRINTATTTASADKDNIVLAIWLI
ncbi:MAG: choice-of-anchor L domain-containing protein [Bacteroidales bacterium]|nr:choice-of-anchor L domain-containing protein [Bacteroidales bacterium]